MRQSDWSGHIAAVRTVHLNGLRDKRTSMCNALSTPQSRHLLQGTRCNDLDILLLFKCVLLYHDLHVN
jgi:hypothetical protein